jgi:hypothetical protein
MYMTSTLLAKRFKKQILALGDYKEKRKKMIKRQSGYASRCDMEGSGGRTQSIRSQIKDIIDPCQWCLLDLSGSVMDGSGRPVYAPKDISKQRGPVAEGKFNLSP